MRVGQHAQRLLKHEGFKGLKLTGKHLRLVFDTVLDEVEKNGKDWERRSGDAEDHTELVTIMEQCIEDNNDFKDEEDKLAGEASKKAATDAEKGAQVRPFAPSRFLKHVCLETCKI